MDVDSDHASATSNVDDWFACFSPHGASKPGAFPFTSHKTQSIESRRARMSDLLIFDVLLVRGGIRSPDMLFPPADWTALRKLLDAIEESVYDILKKDCLVYILLKWAWDIDSREPNTGWDVRYAQDRCIPPQFVALADAYWLLDTGTHLGKAVSILADARLNRDYVSKILQALSLSSSPASFASGTAPATAMLIVKYVRSAKPLLTEPDDIDLYALSLSQLSFMDAWAYQRSFPEGSDTRERLLRKIVGWCLMPAPKQKPLAQLLAFPLSLYEQSSLHALALPSQFSTLSSLTSIDTHTTTTTTGPVLSSQAISILQDLLCVRAIQSGDYVGAIKLDRQFSSVSPTVGRGASSSNSQATSSGRDAIDRKSIIQDLFATLPPAERTLLEDEIGKVAAGVRVNASSTPRQGGSTARRPLMAEMSLSASWEDVGAGVGSPASSASRPSSVVSASFAVKLAPVLASTTSKVNDPPFSVSTSASPFASRVSQPQLVSGHQGPPMPKFTAFGSPIPSVPVASTGRGVISERGKTLFSTSAVGGPSAAVKPATRVSLFDTAGSAKTAPNAFFKPPSAATVRSSLDVTSALASSRTAKSAAQNTKTLKQNGKPQEGESDGEDVSMRSGSDVEILEEDRRNKVGGEEEDDEAVTDEDEDAENFITYDESSAADLTLHTRDVDEVMSEDDGTGLAFSVFNGGRNVTQNGSAIAHGKRNVSGNRHTPHASPPPRPLREDDQSLSTSVTSTTISRRRAPPGAFHHEEDDDEGRPHHREGSKEEEDDRVSLTTPIHSPSRSKRTRMQSETPSRPSTRSQPQRSSKSTTTPTRAASRPSKHTRRTSGRPRLSQTIPGALTDDDNDEHDRGDTDYGDTHGDGDTEMDEQEEEDDEIAPLPSRTSRRTRSSGFVGASTTTSTKSKLSAKSSVPMTTATGAAAAAKGKAKARPSEVRTPARRSSRLSTASSLSPDHAEAVSPTKKERKSTSSRASIAGSGSGAVATRSSSRRKR